MCDARIANLAVDLQVRAISWLNKRTRIKHCRPEAQLVNVRTDVCIDNLLYLRDNQKKADYLVINGVGTISHRWSGHGSEDRNSGAKTRSGALVGGLGTSSLESCSSWPITKALPEILVSGERQMHFGTWTITTANVNARSQYQTLHHNQNANRTKLLQWILLILSYL